MAGKLAVQFVGTGNLISYPLCRDLQAQDRIFDGGEAQLFGVRSFDGPTIALASSVLALVALGAAMLPAWRAASISPTEALRIE